LTEALDEIFAVPVNRADNLDAVESKLFGIGSESYVVGSHEYYLGYAITRKKLLCLDTGHFHPTETIVDKISAVFTHLDEIFAAPVNRADNLDAVESKLFGIGSESYVVGSHEYYLGYAITRKKLLCLDTGHFHPTETIVDKLSAVFTQLDEVLLHVSRGIRWDSDHVVILNDDLRAVFQELVRGNALGRTSLALDFFDASMNRVGAWVIGTRATLKAALAALLEPAQTLQRLAEQGDAAAKLALLEELRTFPVGAVWDMHCLRAGVPAGPAWLNAMHDYETKVQFRRK
jgi:L-rhamnose isomerase